VLILCSNVAFSSVLHVQVRLRWVNLVFCSGSVTLGTFSFLGIVWDRMERVETCYYRFWHFRFEFLLYVRQRCMSICPYTENTVHATCYVHVVDANLDAGGGLNDGIVFGHIWFQILLSILKHILYGHVWFQILLSILKHIL
jgi:hypothetical protein